MIKSNARMSAGNAKTAPARMAPAPVTKVMWTKMGFVSKSINSAINAEAACAPSTTSIWETAMKG